MKRVLIISDSIKRKTGYATVARNILKNLIPTGKYKFAQLGLADVPSRPEFNIDYYSQIKDHSQCCKKGTVLEYKAAEKTEIQYLNLDPQVSQHSDQKACIRGINAQHDHYAYDSVYFVINHFRPDIVIPINDIWGLYNISHLRNRKCFKFIPYLAIDSECLFPILQPPEGRPGLPPIEPVKVIAGTDKTVVFTDWAQDVINKTCKIVTNGKELKNMITIPHGVDTNVWKPLPEKDRKEFREKYFKIKDDTFLIGSVARNQPRKRLDALFQTIRIFIDKYEDSRRPIRCYFHCALQDHLGWNLLWLANYYGVQERCIFDQRLKPGVGPSDEQLNELVNCFDAHVMLTNSEGWCNLPNTNVLCDSGYKFIEDIDVNDYVLTHKGNFKKVTQPLQREYSGDIINIKSYGCGPNISVTPNHNIFIYRDGNFQWIPAEEVRQTDRTCIPIPKKGNTDIRQIDVKKYSKRKLVEDDYLYSTMSNGKKHPTCNPIARYIDLNENFCEVLGNYLAEGCTNSDGTIKFCINRAGDFNIRKNIEYLAKLNNLKIGIQLMERNREVQTLTSRILADFFLEFGKGAHNKFIPGDIFKSILSDEQLTKALIRGIIDGDGSGYVPSNKTNYGAINYTSVSKKLCSQLKILINSLGIHCNIYKAKRGEWALVIQGEEQINKMDFIRNSPKNESRKRKTQSRAKIIDDYITFVIRSIEKEEYTGTVYNLSVEDDESYIAEGIAVHNCLPALEAAAAGVPNVITKYSAHADWGKDTHLFCKVGAWEHEPRTGFVKAIADVNHAAHQLKLLYSSKNMKKDYSNRGVALGNKLAWPKVCKKWEELLDSIDISDLKEGRYEDPETILPSPGQQNSSQFNLQSFGDK